MATGVSDFPTSLDTTSNQPTASTLASIQLDGDGTANNIHSNVHGVSDTAIVALETKLGTGATTPTATAVLVGSGSGTSAWDTTPTFGAVSITDDLVLGIGSNNDGAIVNRTTVLNANTALSGVTIGTPVTPAVAANSTIVSNVTASGDILIATNRGGNTEAHIWMDGSAGDTYFYARGAQMIKLTGGGGVEVGVATSVADNIILGIGTDSDGAIVNRSTVLNANTALTGVTIGTPVTPAVAANSTIVSNVTASGDILVATNRGGNSEAHIWMDGSAGDTYLYARGAEMMKLTGGAGITVSKTLTVGVDDTGHDVKFFGASAGAYMEWDQSEDQLRIVGPTADAAGSSGKLLLATAQVSVEAADILGQIDFQAPLETQGGDGALVTASIQAVAEATFTGTVNNTNLVFKTADDGAATEKFRMTHDGELGIGGANYGTSGQVLTSGGADAAVSWADASSGQSPYDAIVASSGGDYDDLQTAEDALDGGAAYKALVKQATYTESTWTIDTAGAHWVIEGGTTITGSIVLSASDATIEFGPGCTVSATLTISGSGCRVSMQNGFTAVQVVVSGHNNVLDGGGWDTQILGATTGTAVTISGNHNEIRDFKCSTTQGQGNAYNAMNVSGYWNDVEKIYVTASDQDGIYITGATCKVTSCRVTNLDANAISSTAVNNVWVNNLTWETDGIAYFLLSNCDDSVVVGNAAHITTGVPLNIASTTDNAVVVGNRFDGSITNSSSTCTVANNDLT